MGRSYTPRYVLKFDRHTSFGNSMTPSTWRIADSGKPTIANIDKYIELFEQSLIDGCNKHLGIFSIAECYIWDQKLGVEVCRWIRRVVRPNESPFRIVA